MNLLRDPLGISMRSRDLQPKNVSSPIDLMLFGIYTDSKDSQNLNTPSPSVLTLLGIHTVFSDLHK